MDTWREYSIGLAGRTVVSALSPIHVILAPFHAAGLATWEPCRPGCTRTLRYSGSIALAAGSALLVLATVGLRVLVIGQQGGGGRRRVAYTADMAGAVGEQGGWGCHYLAVFRQINLESFRVVLESERCHGEENVFAVNRLPLFLVAFLGCWRRHLVLVTCPASCSLFGCCLPSLVIKLMNSLTHSCIHSLASFAILAFSGRASFMIRATGAKLRMLASYTSDLSGLEARGASGDWEGKS